MDEWGRGRAADLAALVAAALPQEDLRLDDLLACCWDDPEPGSQDVGAVLATDDGSGAASVVIRRSDKPSDGSVGYLKLLVVHPDAQHAGRGRALLTAAERWVWEHGAHEMRLAGAAPFYLWPGIDVLATHMLCLAEAAGYGRIGTDVNMTLPTGFRASPPSSVALRRVLDEADVAMTLSLVEPIWPEWTAEVARAIEHGCCHAAFVPQSRADRATGGAVGFACHSVNRAGWVGPMGTDQRWRRTGIGRALLSEVCRDLMVADLSHAEICWAGPIRFYARQGATVSRVFFRYCKQRP